MNVVVVHNVDGIVRFGTHGYLDFLGNVVLDEYFMDLWERMVFGGIHVAHR